ncbi:helix-turn-helix domain-containing protein, partial [Streptomyces sp. NPDC059762]|uniref:helix-turn-helix domain-containing protein n=1 Tax=Streptomyces sp. NPDC059762 TaxID=3346938 RepID=UPI0036607F7E
MAVVRPEEAVRPEEVVGPLERGLAVVRAVVDGGGRRGLGEVARATGLARATVDRVATTLTVLGVLRAEGRDLLLAPGAAELGNAYLDFCGLPARLGPHAAALAEELDAPVSRGGPRGGGGRRAPAPSRPPPPRWVRVPVAAGGAGSDVDTDIVDLQGAVGDGL